MATHLTAQTTAPSTAGRKRRRRVHVSSRDLSFLCIGAVAALGAKNRLDLQPIIAERLAFVGPNTTTSSASSYEHSSVSPDKDVAAQCGAKLKRCREKKQRQLSNNGADPDDSTGRRRLQAVRTARLELPKGMKLVPPKPQQQTPQQNIYVEPDCAHRGPYQSIVPCYTTEALHREIERHDRFIVDSVAYMNAFDGNAIPSYEVSSDTAKEGGITKPVTMVILTVHRYVPYLAALLTSLLRGHRPDYLRDTIDLHVINIERRECKCGYHLFGEYQSRIPFASFHDWTADYPEHKGIVDDTKQYLANQRRDYVRALKLCKGQKSKWCVILEDDVVVSANFVPKFMELMSKEESLSMQENVGVISLYYPLNDIYNFNQKELWRTSYATSNAYALDVNATKYSGVNLSGKHRIDYQLESNDRKYGMAANAYPLGVLDELIGFLQREPSNSTKQNTDVAIMNEFIEATKKKRLKISPSLVGHIGVYSEHRANVKEVFVGNRKESKKGSGVFFMLSSDVRFHLESGWDESRYGVLEEHESTKGHAFK